MVVETTLYASLPLRSSTTIRVLCINTRSFSLDNDDIVCEIKTIDLDTKPDFDALSIAWVEEGKVKTRKVRCDGHEIYISDNCYQALAELHRVRRTLSIFVPTVSVDQESESEKQHHVALAQELLSAAQNTYLWLGGDNIATDEAMTLFSAGRGLRHIFYQKGDSASGKPRWFISIYARLLAYPWVLSRSTDDSIQLRTRAGKGITSSKNLIELLESSWISCVWTVQEVVLAKNPIVIHRKCHVSWTDFATTILYLHRMHGYNYKLKLKLEPWVDLILCKDYVHTRQEFEETGVARGILTKLFQLLHDMSVFHCLFAKWADRARTFFWTNIIIWITTGWAPIYSALIPDPAKHNFLYIYCIGIFFWIANIFGFIRISNNDSLNTEIFDHEMGPVDEVYLNEKFVSAMLRRRSSSSSSPVDVYHATRGVFATLLRRKLPSVRNLRNANREMAMNLLEASNSLTLIEKAAETSMKSADWALHMSDPRRYILSDSVRIGRFHATAMSNLPKGTVLNKPILEPPETLTLNGVHLHTITSIHALQATHAEYKTSEHDVHLSNYWTMHDLVTASNKKHESCYKKKANFKGLHEKHISDLKSIITPELVVFLDSVWRYKSAGDLTAHDLVNYIKHFVPDKDSVDMSVVFTTPNQADPYPSLWPAAVTTLFRVHLEVSRLLVRLDFVFFRATIGWDYVGPLWSWIDGKVFGICSKHAAIGDEVVLMEGLPEPFIMRPCDGNYKLVSLAYIFGMMQGQAWEHKDDSGRKPVYVHNRQHQITIVQFGGRAEEATADS